MARLSIGIVTWQSADVIEACLDSVRRLTWPDVEVRVLDNASNDGTRAALERLTTADERLYLPENVGFAAAHNQLIRRSSGEFYLALNPDVELESGFVEPLLDAMAVDPTLGSATGKLVRFEPPGVIDSAGIVMVPSQRHLDRGAGEPDDGRFDRREYVFGASGAAACYRRAMLDDVRVAGEYFDEHFFAYREDADLAWRSQLFGWSCAYVPAARARHRRRVTPERRSSLSADVNRYGVRNRFLLRLKNQPLGHALTFALPTLVRDLQVVGYVLLRERSSVGGLVDVIRLLPEAWAKRQEIQRRRTMSVRALNAWFRQESRPWPGADSRPGSNEIEPGPGKLG
ncbi:MAG: glycosyltransferase family 2 protein [Vicinamibacterales bacterium]